MLANWIKQAVAAGGVGNLTLGSAISGHIDLNTAIGQGPRFPYVIEDGNNRETGIGYLSASTTLVRESILETLVSGVFDNTSPAALNVTTSAMVMIAAVASQSFRAPNTICADYPDTGYIMDATASGSGTVGTLANRIYLASFHLPCRAEISGMGMEVTTAATGNAVAGIYQSISRASAVKIAQVANEFDTSTTGQKTASFSANIVLNPGYYAVALNLSAAPQIRTNLGSIGHLGGLYTGTANLGARYGSSTYSATMPATLASSLFSAFAAGTPRLVLLGA